MIGTGGVRVALLLPRSAGGNGGGDGARLPQRRRARDARFPDAGIQVAVYDTQGHAGRRRRPRSARRFRRARRSCSARSSPTRSSAVAPQARAAGVPVVAFSSDAGVAGPGVYLLSFLPSDDVNRIVSYSASQGRKSFAALLPANAYGSVVEAAFRSAVATAGGRIVAIQTYRRTTPTSRAKAAAIASDRAADRRAARSRCRRRRAGDRRGARRRRRHARQGEAPRLRPVGRSAHPEQPGAGRKLVPGAASSRALRNSRANTRRPTARRRRATRRSPMTRPCSPPGSSASTAPTASRIRC